MLMLKKRYTAMVLIHKVPKLLTQDNQASETLVVENKLVQSFCREICQYVNMYNTLWPTTSTLGIYLNEIIGQMYKGMYVC